MVSGSGADIHKLLGLSFKQSIVALKLGWDKADKITYNIEAHVLNHFGNLCFVIHIHNQFMQVLTVLKNRISVATVNQVKFMSFG